MRRGDQGQLKLFLCKRDCKTTDNPRLMNQFVAYAAGNANCLSPSNIVPNRFEKPQHMPPPLRRFGTRQRKALLFQLP
jgi:hypothetical protein